MILTRPQRRFLLALSTMPHGFHEAREVWTVAFRRWRQATDWRSVRGLDRLGLVRINADSFEERLTLTHAGERRARELAKTEA